MLQHESTQEAGADGIYNSLPFPPAIFTKAGLHHWYSIILVVALLVNLTKAFDCISHHYIIAKLAVYGLKEYCLTIN